MSIYNNYSSVKELFKKEDTSFTCAICSKKLKVFHATHLKLHDITKEEYISLYGIPNKYYEKKIIAESIVKKINDIFVSQSYKWGYLSSFSGMYYTLHKKQKEYRKMHFNDIKKHLSGGNTLVAFPRNGYSKWLLFDIDTYEYTDSNNNRWSSRADAIDLINNLKHILEGYIPADEIHVTSSGNKGYHIELYFNEYIQIEALALFFSILLYEVKIEQFDGVDVEMRPELKGVNGRGIKIPLGHNHTNLYGSNYCAYLDDDFNHIENEINYVMSIRKTNKDSIYKLINDYKDIEIDDYKDKYKCEKEVNLSDKEKYSLSKTNTTPCNRSSLWSYYNNGLLIPGTRHDITFKLIMLFKEVDYTIEEAEQKIKAWTEQQIKNGLSKGNVNEINKDIKNILKDVYYRKTYYLPTIMDVFLTKDDLKLLEALQLKSREISKRVINHQKLLFSLIIQSKRYADKDGLFSMTYGQMLDSTTISSKSTINKIINELFNWGFIDIISRNKKGTHVKNLPNVYKILNVIDDKSINVYHVCSNKDICNYCYINMIKHCYRYKDMKYIISDRVKYKIKNSSSMNCIYNN